MNGVSGRSHQQVRPAAVVAERHQSHLLDERDLSLPRHLLLLPVPLGGRLAGRAVHQHSLAHREVLHKEHQAPLGQLVDLLGREEEGGRNQEVQEGAAG